MNGYDIALAALNLVSVGLEAKDIQARLQTEIDNGTPHEAVPALLEKWRDEAIADAASAKPGDPTPAEQVDPVPPTATTQTASE
jgi:hypothetical protein